MSVLAFRTEAPRAGWAAPASSGRFAGLEMMERKDMQAQRQVKPSRVTPELERSRLSARARDWVRRAGFPVEQQSYAISAAMEISRRLGPGAVTRAAVRLRLQQWPYCGWMESDNEKGAQDD